MAEQPAPSTEIFTSIRSLSCCFWKEYNSWRRPGETVTTLEFNLRLLKRVANI